MTVNKWASDVYSKFILLIRDLLRYQTNMDEHDPEICDDVNLWMNKTTNCYKIRPQLTAPGAMVLHVDKPLSYPLKKAPQIFYAQIISSPDLLVFDSASIKDDTV